MSGQGDFLAELVGHIAADDPRLVRVHDTCGCQGIRRTAQ
jgi:hypothetical protein